MRTHFLGKGLLSAALTTLFAIACSEGPTQVHPTEGDSTSKEALTLNASRIKDIRTSSTNGDSVPYVRPVRAGNKAYFFTKTPAEGTELWVSDGTEIGTHLVYDAYPGPTSSSDQTPANMGAVGDTLYFSPTVPGVGVELWKTDGTAAGTSLVKDAVPGEGGLFPQYLTDVGGTLFFVGSNQQTGGELWKSDGTAQGTVMVRDINPQQGSNPTKLTNVAGTLFFLASDGTHGTELWKSDGTEQGTVMVKNITSGSQSTTINELAAVGNKLVFYASTPDYGPEIWVSDGTENGTHLLKDIYPGTSGSTPWNILSYGEDKAVFIASDNTHGRELWITDGTENGTVMVKDVLDGPSEGLQNAQLFVGNGLVYFTAPTELPSGGGGNGIPGGDAPIEGDIPNQLWRSDGTENGTYNITEVQSGFSGGSFAETPGGVVFFSYDTIAGYEMFWTDGTLNSPVLLKDIRPGSESPDSQFAPVSTPDFAIFWANDGTHGAEPWKTDGTEEGTKLLKDIEISTSGDPVNLINLSNRLFFAVNTNDGPQMWRTSVNGTDAAQFGTGKPGMNSYEKPVVFGSNYLFYFNDSSNKGLEPFWFFGLASSLIRDIEVGAGSSNPRYAVALGNKVYFQAGPGGDNEPWVSDGTSNGTFELADYFPGAGSHPYNFTATSDAVYFVATTVNSYNLYKSQGTSQTTTLVTSALDGYNWLTPMGSTLFFASTSGSSGQELYKTDGTSQGTVRVRDINPTGDSYPSSLAVVDGVLYFSAYDDESGSELWRSDGTEQGTQRVADINVGTGSSSPSRIIGHEGKIYFRATDGESGYELWVYDPGVSPTDVHLVKDINPGPASGLVDAPMVSVTDGPLVFSASDGPSGAELWASDGTEQGTWMVEDIASGGNSSSPTEFVLSGQKVFFAATDNAGDRELWSSDLTTLQTGPAPAAPPEASVTSPINNAALNTNHPTFSGSSSSGSTVDIYIDDVMVTTVTAAGNGIWTYTPSITTNGIDTGSHKIKVQGTNTAGQGPMSSEVNFTIDTQLPLAPEIDAPTDPNTKDKTPVVTGTAEPNSTVKVYSGSLLVGTVTADGQGNWSVETSTLTDGEHLITAKATDAAGNESDPSAGITLNVDTSTPDKPTLTAPTGGTVLGDNTPTFTGTAEPNSTVHIMVDDVAIGTATTDQSGNWTFTPTVSIPDGARTITTKAVDAAGNESDPSQGVAVTVDVTPPTAPTFTSPDDNAWVNENKPQIKGEGEPGTTVTVSIDGNVVGTAVIDQHGKWTFDVQDALPEGAHEVTATTKDSGNNVSPISSTWHLKVDTEPPSAPTLTGPTGPTSDSTPDITGTGAEPGATVSIYINGHLSGTAVADSSGNFIFTVPTSLGEASYSAYATVTDPATNTGDQSSPIVFSVDTTAPSTPSQGGPDGYIETGTPAFTGTAEAGAVVTIYVDGVAIGTTTADSLGEYSFTPETPIPDGPHTSYVTVKDSANNVSEPSSTANFIVDTAGPVITLTEPAPDAYLNISQPVIHGMTEPGARITLVLDGVSHKFEAAEDGSWSFTPESPLEDGAHTVTVNAADSAKNQSGFIPQQTFTIDTAAPDTIITMAPPSSDNNADPIFKVSSNEEGVTYECALDGADYVPCTAEMELEGLKPGSHTLSARAVDKAGNKDETPVEYAWEISMDAAPRVAGGGIGCSQAGVSQLLPFAGLFGLSLLLRRKRRAAR